VVINVTRQDTAWEHFSNYIFEIEDTGVGIRADDLERIFLPFNQVHEADNRKVQGSGLGLSVAKKITEALEGAIGVRSVLGSGSTFWVKIPLESLPQGTYFPSLHSLPVDADSLFITAKYFGGSKPSHILPTAPLIVGTNFVGRSLDTLVHYLTSWGVHVELIKQRQQLESFLEAGHFMFVLDSTSPELLQILISRTSTSLTGLNILVFSALSSLHESSKLSDSIAAPSRIAILPKPLEPLKLYRGSLFLLGVTGCLKEEKNGPQHQDSHPKPQLELPPDLPRTPTHPSLELHSHNPGAIDVLVVEDNQVNQMIMKRILEKLKVKHLITANADEALEIWKSSLNSIPLIFMDVEVEGSMNGLQLTSLLRELEAERERGRTEAGFPQLERSHIAIMTGRAIGWRQCLGAATTS
jgi:CheY-like chemotaxis protein